VARLFVAATSALSATSAVLVVTVAASVVAIAPVTVTVVSSVSVASSGLFFDVEGGLLGFDAEVALLLLDSGVVPAASEVDGGVGTHVVVMTVTELFGFGEDAGLGQGDGRLGMLEILVVLGLGVVGLEPGDQVGEGGEGVVVEGKTVLLDLDVLGDDAVVLGSVVEH
jgi:hypothetical protein